MKLPITPEFTAGVTGHGETKSYLHRFKLTDSPTCPCNEGVQTPEHLMYDCKLLEVQRSSLKQHIMADGGNWSTKQHIMADGGNWPTKQHIMADGGNWPTKQHIMADGGNWPTPNSELAASYLKSFTRFVKSIDFNKLQ
jgi:hypothetical protein